MKGMDFGVSPVKSGTPPRPTKGFFNEAKKKARTLFNQFGAPKGKHGTIKDVMKKSAKGAGKRALGFLGLMGGGSLSASAQPKNNQKNLENFKFGRGQKIK